ncbi:MAG: hypothetical protein KAV00_14795 [Phycisphaerae bacterium]|nr:hypothetical protein [Phycisphaerae bacterium]
MARSRKTSRKASPSRYVGVGGGMIAESHGQFIPPATGPEDLDRPIDGDIRVSGEPQERTLSLVVGGAITRPSVA